jgi:hypothetical protein
MERGGGPSYTPDQLPHPLIMSEGAGCTRGMATAPLNDDRPNAVAVEQGYGTVTIERGHSHLTCAACPPHSLSEGEEVDPVYKRGHRPSPSPVDFEMPF